MAGSKEHEDLIGQSSHSPIKDLDRGDSHKSQPHLAEFMRLKNEVEHLREQLKSEHGLSARLEIKRRISCAKRNLTRERIFMRLHGEGKRSFASRVRSQIDMWSEYMNSLVARGILKLKKLDERTERNLRLFLHMKLPPSVFSLGSLDVSERRMDTKEWIRKLHPHRRTVMEKDTRQ